MKLHKKLFKKSNVVTFIALLGLGAGQFAYAETMSKEEEQIEVIEVKSSSRIIRDGFESPTPTTTMSAESLQNQGLINVADLLNQSPAFRDSETSATRTTGLGGSNVGNYVNMRGLGEERTLVLLNGSRIVPTTNIGTTDLNLMPTIALQRTDVVTGGASAAWGSDAVAGVVNLITKKGFSGVQLEARGGQTAEKDAKSASFSLLVGHDIDDTTNILFAAEYENTAESGGVDSRSWSAPMTGNLSGPNGTVIIASDLQFGIFSPGGRVLGPPPLGGQDFGATGSTLNPATDTGTRYGGGAVVSGGDYYLTHPVSPVSLTTPIDRYSALLSVDKEMSDTLYGTFELNYGRSATDFNSVPYLGIQCLKADNPYLPTDVAAAITGPCLSVGKIASLGGMAPYHFDRENETYRASFKLEGEISNDWHWDAHYSYGRNKNYAGLGNNVLTYANATDPSMYPVSASPLNQAVDAVLENGEIVCRSGAAGCVPFNFLGQGTYSQAAYDYITGTAEQNVTTKQHNLAFNINGDIGETSAGPIVVAAGYEYRVDKIDGSSDEKSQNSLYDVFNPQPFSGELDVNEVYAEVLVPLLADIDFAQALDVNLAVRYADYEKAGGATTWKLGFSYQINDEVRLRASSSRDIRAPNLRETFLAGQTGQTSTLTGYSGYPNPALVSRQISGNRELKPEESETISFGFSYRPENLQGFSIGADYYDITITDAIASVGASALVFGCEAGNKVYCNQIDFYEGDPTGKTISVIREQPINIDTITTRGVDIELGYRLDALGGNFDLRMLGAYVAEMTDSGSGGLNRAGQIGPGALSTSEYTAPKWIWDTNLRYTRDAFGVNLHSRYIDSGVIDITAKPGGENADKVLSALNGDPVVDNTVASKIYFDLSADYNFVNENGTSIQLYAGVRNIFNTKPPAEFGVTIFGSSRLGSLYDVLGTAYHAGVRVKF